MNFDGAVIREQGVTFAIVIVKPNVLQIHQQADRVAAEYQRTFFPGIPVVLMAQDPRGTPTYYGRSDIAKFLAGIPLSAIPWKRYRT